MGESSESEQMRYFSGVDNEPFTKELEAELVARGWKAADIETARNEGATYNRHRDSIVYPLEFEGPMFEKGSSLTREGIGRNDPCPCGSGKKYKKCCGLD